VKRLVLAWGPPVALSAVIFFLSSRSTLPMPTPAFAGADKVGHFAVYAVLGWLLARGAWMTGLSPWWAVAIGVLYGATDEFHQSFVPGRTPEFLDWVADAAGVMAAVYLHHRWRSRRRAPRRGAPRLREQAQGSRA
jgi:VanZ family protein